MNLSERDILQTLMRERTRVSAAAWLIVRDTHAAEDIFQNIAVKAMTREVSFENEALLMSWAFITARREGIDWLRRHQRECLGLDAEVLNMFEVEWQAPMSPAAGTKMEALQSCLEATPESARRMLKLRYFEGHSCEEVAGHLGLGLDATYKRLSRLHQSLKECIEGKLKHVSSHGELAP